MRKGPVYKPFRCCDTTSRPGQLERCRQVAWDPERDEEDCCLDVKFKQLKTTTTSWRGHACEGHLVLAARMLHCPDVTADMLAPIYIRVMSMLLAIEQKQAWVAHAEPHETAQNFTEPHRTLQNRTKPRRTTV